jgi:hypothetical protein
MKISDFSPRQRVHLFLIFSHEQRKSVIVTAKDPLNKLNIFVFHSDTSGKNGCIPLGSLIVTLLRRATGA